jgi:hypothetical protein
MYSGIDRSMYNGCETRVILKNRNAKRIKGQVMSVNSAFVNEWQTNLAFHG